MKNKFLAAIAAPLLLCAAAAAHAADLPRRGAPDPYYAPPPASMVNWQGFYLGVNAGYGFSSLDGGDYNFLYNLGNMLGSPGGGLVGFTGGYNFVPSQNLLLGLEADFDFSGMRTNQTPFFGIASQTSVNDLVTVRGRAGYIMDRALIFVTGGFAGARTSIGLVNAYQLMFQGQNAHYQVGWTIGGGLEYMLTNTLSAKAEYLYSSVGSDRFFNYQPAPLQIGVNISTIKAGVNYHF